MHQKIKTRWLPLGTLIISSTLIAELLSGSTPVSRIGQLALQFFMYGCGSVVVREVVRRRGLGWGSIVVLGFVYGLIEEGLVLQSMFNPAFLHLNITFGRAAGVNWVWAEYLTGLHAFWSISCSILLCEVIFPEGRERPWVGLPVLWVCGALYVLICLAMHGLFIRLFGYRAPVVSSLGLGGVVVVLVVFALTLPRVKVIAADGGNFWVLLLVTLAAGVCWFLGIYTILSPHKPALWIVLGAGPLLAAIYFGLVSGWRAMRVRTDMDRLAVAGGLLGADLILGYTGTVENRIDHWGQIGLIIGVSIMLVMLYRRHAGRALL